jgi:hypothetical protein
LGGGEVRSVLPFGLSEMNVAVPEASDNGLSGAIHGLDIRRNVHPAFLSDGGDFSILDQDYAV